jgi:hypothetical protein
MRISRGRNPRCSKDHDGAVAPVEGCDHRLELDRRERPDFLARLGRDLAHGARGVAGDQAVLDGDLKDARQARERLAHGVGGAAAAE